MTGRSTHTRAPPSVSRVTPNVLEEKSASLTGTALQNLPHFLKYGISSHFRTICSLKDADVIKGALKGMIFYFSTPSGRFAGIINERTSLLILVAVNVASYLKDSGLPFIVFAGIHSSTFFAVSSARLRMSVDLYIDRFIPELAKALSTETKDPKITVDLLVQAIILPFFRKRRSTSCLARGKLLVDFTSAHRGFFTQQAALFEESDSRLPKDTKDTLSPDTDHLLSGPFCEVCSKVNTSPRKVYIYLRDSELRYSI
ncbi:hypothetical protein CRM22_008521 [Opisthorchis felineus]|uniref:Uncharacterized protein n=1 Tax=Opisthorchis felineus TaxID=147828 RepID=A0A4S2LCR7_OPIFE|nr:hypothetical protein CRM22_008521 [Opisthorchis felineus]